MFGLHIPGILQSVEVVPDHQPKSVCLSRTAEVQVFLTLLLVGPVRLNINFKLKYQYSSICWLLAGKCIWIR